MYEQSCEAYKHLGKTSDTYWIDPDGSGPLGPFKVYCNMTEDKVWTTLYHDMAQQRTISGSTPMKPVVVKLNYSTSLNQIAAVTKSAEYCEQYVSYFCRMSRLLNTPVYFRKHLLFKLHKWKPFSIFFELKDFALGELTQDLNNISIDDMLKPDPKQILLM
ncbi:hypothetical protein scyTo_0002482 [Scyliorhinus torazame]|uniref:Fibrinogen C-terminal domain-containing protein n=1 Tax=Scyliorhinus torazame TaxID=75743 RepID=A0A401PJQ3_SCYTO|nr:hypothetical protein [Scyliorhinus torazame]